MLYRSDRKINITFEIVQLIWKFCMFISINVIQMMINILKEIFYKAQ